jgi:hypothetical protein
MRTNFFGGTRIVSLEFVLQAATMGGRSMGSWWRYPMARDKWMEGYAQDCIRLARLTPDAGIQEELVKMAGQWMAAARGSKQRQTTSQIRHQSTPATSVDTPRSRHVAGAKKR